MVLQLGNWGLVPGQNPAIRHGCQADSWPARRVVSQSVTPSVCHSVSPGSNESMHGHAVTCCLGQTKLCGQHLLVAHFAAFCFWLTGSLRVAGGGELMMKAGGDWVPTGCQSFVLQCPNYFIDLPSTFVQFGVLHTLRHPRASTGIPGHPRASQGEPSDHANEPH